MNRKLRITLILLGAIAVAVLVIVANISRFHSQVRGVEVSIRYGHAPMLVDEQTVVDSILKSVPRLQTMSVKDVDCNAVAEAASHVPYLKDVSSSVSVSGKVVVRATQRRPIARLFYGGKELLFDADGAIMPVSRYGDCDVLVAGGDFTEALRVDSLNSQMTALLTLARFLDDENKYSGIIDQLYIKDDGDIMMVPKLGDQLIELGDAEDLDGKFSNLMTFYRKGMPRAGWNTYTKISLKFRNQVVCTKEKK